MWEWIVGFWLLLLTWIAIPWIWVPIICFGVFSDYRDNGFWAGAWMLLAGAGLYLFFSATLTINLTYLLYAAIAYIPIGLVWSFYRFRCLVNDRVIAWNKESVKYRQDEYHVNAFQERLAATHNLGDITYWILFWPVSMIANVLNDLIRLLESLVTKFFRKIYDGITSSAIKKMDIPVAEDTEEEKEEN